MNDNFIRIIGLGSACTTKVQINLYFNPGSNPIQTKANKADVFDWLHINDYNLFADAINQDFFKLEDFSTNTVLNTEAAIINTKYNMLWNHIFKGMKPPTPMTDLFLKKNFNELKNKINYLTEKFYSAREVKTLYIISDVDYDPLNLKKRPTFEDLVKLRNSLIENRENNNFILLYIGINTNFENFENIVIYKDVFPHGSIFNTEINPNWKKALDQFEFSEDIY